MKRNRFIDVLKGICIVFVVITHFSWSGDERKNLLFPFWIDMAVPIFMVISGFVYYQSFERSKVADFQTAYSLKNIIPKLMRYTLPFAIAFITQVIIGVSRGVKYTALSLIQLFLVGGQGPGSYYYPVMVQYVFLFPFIYMTVRKNGKKGLLLWGILNLVFETTKWAYGMNEKFYRLLIFRYLFLIAFGCYIAMQGKDNKLNIVYSIIACAVSIFFTVHTYYNGYKPVFFAYWTSTCMLACLFILPLMVILLSKCRFGFLPMEIVGKASFHIFLVQMLYYQTFDREVCADFGNRWTGLAVGVLICITVGIVFYFIETPICKFLNGKIKKLLSKKETDAVPQENT